MINSNSLQFQFAWAVTYAIWLIIIKPKSSQFAVSVQAFTAQTFGLTAIFLQWGDSSILQLVALAWLVCYLSARHFFSSFEEPLSVFLASVWGYFAGSAVWVLSHWLIFYGFIAQTTLVLSVVAFSLASIYYLDRTDRLSLFMRRQLVFIMIVVVLIIMIGLTRQGYVLKSQQ